MATPAQGPWTKYAAQAPPWEKYKAAQQPDISSEASMAVHPPTAPQPAPMQTTAQTEATRRTQLENAGGSPKAHPSNVLQSYNRETGQNETPEQHNRYLGTAVTTGMALGTGGTSLAEGIAANGLRAGLAPLVKGVGGSIAGKFIGREAGGMIGHPEAGATIGGLAGGLYGLGGGKIPTNHAELSELLEPQAKLPQGWTGEETAAPTVGIGSPSPTYGDYALKRGAEINSAMKQQPEAFGIGSPEPVSSPLGSPDNPGFHSKLPSRLPTSLRGDPFSPAPKPELSPINTGAKTGVAILPEPRAPFEGENEGFMASVPRARLGKLGVTGKPGAGTQLQQLGQHVVYAPRGSEIESPSMDALRESLGIGSPEPRYAYRAHTIGQPEVDLGAHAHATLSPEEAEAYAQHRNAGANQTVSRIDLNKFVPEHLEETPGPRSANWVKFKRQLSATDYE
jgi:hypothetical protein